MLGQLMLTVMLVSGDATANAVPPSPVLPSPEAAAKVPALAKQADTSFLLQAWARAADQYRELVAANPTVGLYWWRLGTCLLETGKYEDAIPAFEKSEELGGFQWNPPRMIFRGESAWGLAAAHARAGHRDEALRWTRTSISQGLRDIQRFRGKHFASLTDDLEFRKLIWSDDAKKLSRDEGFRHDLRFMMHEAKRMHYAPFRVTPEAELDAMAERLSADIPNLTDEQVLVRMMAIVRRLGDGHTQIRRGARPSARPSPGARTAILRRMPVHFFLFPEGLYIDGVLAPHNDLVGAKVLKIGDRSAQESLDLAEDIVSRDNAMTVQSFTPSVLASPPILRGLGIVSGEGPVSLEIEDVLGKTRRVEIAPQEVKRIDQPWINQVPGRGELPLTHRHRDKTYWFELLSDQRAIYCQMNGIGTDNSTTMTDFCRKLFDAVAQPEVEALILDLRHNGGGDTFTNPPLIEGIIRSEKLQKHGNLFVIIGRGTFSAAQNTTSELERRTKAILVGEPTGSRPNFIGESLQVPLPYSGWQLSPSDLWWQHSMSMDYRSWTPPALYAPPTAASFRAHTDPCMDVITAFRATVKKP